MSSSFSGKHNICSVYHGFRALAAGACCLIQGGMRRRRSDRTFPLAFPCKGVFGFRRGGAYSISMPAARSSARASIIRFSNSIKSWRKLAMRFMRVSLNSASWPLFKVSTYWTNRRSRSSAVSVLGIGIFGEELAEKQYRAVFSKPQNSGANQRYAGNGTPVPDGFEVAA